ncbi:MAG: NAD(P)H-hydrate epimerase [Nitrososphaeraceae archaeon]
MLFLRLSGIVDALFGTGYSSGRIKDPQSTVIDLINSSKAYVVSNDIPSGTNADTAQVVEKSVKPNITVVLHRKKPGVTWKYLVQSIGIPKQVDYDVLIIMSCQDG